MLLTPNCPKLGVYSITQDLWVRTFYSLPFYCHNVVIANSFSQIKNQSALEDYIQVLVVI